MRKTLLCLVIVLSCGSALAGSISNERLYDKIVELRDSDPDRFAGTYPFISRLVTDDKFFDKLHDRWLAHPARFEHYHDPLLIRILDGKHTPPLPPMPPPPLLPEPPNHPPCGCGHQTPIVTIPEPTSLAMLPIGLGLVLLVRRAIR